MKKTVCMLFALALIFALAGCRTTNRPYRRYATPHVTEGGMYDTYNRTYRKNPDTNTTIPSDRSLYNGSQYRATPRTMTGRASVASPAVPLPTATTPAPRTATSPKTAVTPGRTNKSFNVAS